MIIYKTTNLLNDIIYVGFHKTSADDGYLGSGTNILKAIKKYGKENFNRVTLEDVKTTNWKQREIHWISALSATCDVIGYNINKGGGDFPISKGDKIWWANATDEQRKKHRISVKRTHADVSGKNNPMYGKNRTFTPEWKDRISKGMKGRKPIWLSKKIIFEGIEYDSISEASRKTGLSQYIVKRKGNVI